MKYFIRLLLVITLSVLSACGRNQDAEPAPSPDADIVANKTQVTPALQEIAAKPSLAAGQYEVTLSDNAIIIRANQVNEYQLFKAVAEKAKFQLLAENFEWKTVSVDIHTEKLHDAVVELVSGYPHEIVYAPNESGLQETLSEVVIGKPPPVTENKQGDRKRVKRDRPLDPAQEALLYIKEYTPEEQQRVYLQKLQDPAVEIRAAAAKQIMPTPESLPVMIDLLANDPSPEVRIASTWSLETSNAAEAPQAIAALVKCLGDPDTDVIVECIDSLSFIGDETTIEYLTPFLTHENEDVREAALEAIRFLQ